MQPRDRASTPHLLLVCAVFTALTALLLLGGLPPRRNLSSAAGAYLAVRTVLVSVGVASLAVVAMTLVMCRRNARTLAPLIPAGLLAVCWFAALYALLMIHSPWALSAACGFVVSLAAWRRRHETLLSDPRDLTESQVQRPILSLPPQPRWPISSMLGGLGFQSGWILSFAGMPWMGTLLFGIGVATLVFPIFRALPAPRPEPFHRTATRSWNAAAAAVILIFVGLFPYIEPPPSFELVPGQAPVKATGGHTGGTPVPRGAPSVNLGETYPAIILWPEHEPNRTLLVPPLPTLGKGWNVQDAPRTTIPFFGVYWFLRPPDQVPNEATAVVLRGDPVKRSFRATGARPLTMVAHQNLGRLISLACCSAIEVAFDNIDRYPGTIALELSLVDTTVSPPKSQPLGSRQVTSAPRWRPGEQNQVSEVLTFLVPDAASIAAFDQFTVRFSLGAIRSDRSARLALRRFTLLPRR